MRESLDQRSSLLAAYLSIRHIGERKAITTEALAKKFGFSRWQTYFAVRRAMQRKDTKICAGTNRGVWFADQDDRIEQPPIAHRPIPANAGREDRIKEMERRVALGLSASHPEDGR